LLLATDVRVLEARFHPQRRQQPDFVTLGYLVWRRPHRREPPVFEPARTALPDPVVSKLRYLVGVTGPDSFERLQRLRSDYWSFVPIAAAEIGQAPAAGARRNAVAAIRSSRPRPSGGGRPRDIR
jgi:hypothetical protein